MSDIVIIGAGPSGLSAAVEAAKNGSTVTVIEKLEQVGGLARTIEFDGNRFDIGPHRFFTRNDEVRTLFEAVVGPDLVRVPRLTRILHDGVYFDYPLTPLNALMGIGLGGGLAIVSSYASARVRRSLTSRPAETFEDWIVDHFGRTLFETFFKTYTEKVWGIPCNRIGADWAAQRIRGLSLTTALCNALFKTRSATVKTLVDEFSYPRLGAGQTYEKMANSIGGAGRVTTRAKVVSMHRDGMRVRAVTVEDPDGNRYDVEGQYFLSSATLSDTIAMMEPPAPPEVVRSCRALRYRDHIAVNLVIAGSPFPDNWIYVHDANARIARIANYRNFSPEMAQSPDVSPITAEYFTFPQEDLALSSDADLVELATQDLEQLGLVERDRINAGFVVRSAQAYPVMEIGYRNRIDTIRNWLDGFENLLPIGRSGMFKYNNQDHAMATGMLAARTALGLGRFDPWRVNIDAEYQEGSSVQHEPAR